MQLGTGDTEWKYSAFAVAAFKSGTVAVALSSSATCVIMYQGSVSCFGWNHYGQVPRWLQSTFVLVVTISAGGRRNLLLYQHPHLQRPKPIHSDCGHCTLARCSSENAVGVCVLSHLCFVGNYHQSSRRGDHPQIHAFDVNSIGRQDNSLISYRFLCARKFSSHCTR